MPFLVDYNTAFIRFKAAYIKAVASEGFALVARGDKLPRDAAANLDRAKTSVKLHLANIAFMAASEKYIKALRAAAPAEKLAVTNQLKPLIKTFENAVESIQVDCVELIPKLGDVEPPQGNLPELEEEVPSTQLEKAKAHFKRRRELAFKKSTEIRDKSAETVGKIVKLQEIASRCVGAAHQQMRLGQKAKALEIAKTARETASTARTLADLAQVEYKRVMDPFLPERNLQSSTYVAGYDGITILPKDQPELSRFVESLKKLTSNAFMLTSAAQTDVARCEQLAQAAESAASEAEAVTTGKSLVLAFINGLETTMVSAGKFLEAVKTVTDSSPQLTAGLRLIKGLQDPLMAPGLKNTLEANLNAMRLELQKVEQNLLKLTVIVESQTKRIPFSLQSEKNIAPRLKSLRDMLDTGNNAAGPYTTNMKKVIEKVESLDV